MLKKSLVLDNIQSYQVSHLMENTQFQNIETLAQDSLTHLLQQDSKKEENQELLDPEITLEKNKVWQKMVNTFSQDSKTVNVERLDKHKEIHGELKREVVIQDLVITEFHLTLGIMNHEKLIKKEWLKLHMEDDQEEVLFIQEDRINPYLLKRKENKIIKMQKINHHYKKNDLYTFTNYFTCICITYFVNFTNFVI